MFLLAPPSSGPHFNNGYPGTRPGARVSHVTVLRAILLTVLCRAPYRQVRPQRAACQLRRPAPAPSPSTPSPRLRQATAQTSDASDATAYGRRRWDAVHRRRSALPLAAVPPPGVHAAPLRPVTWAPLLTSHAAHRTSRSVANLGFDLSH